MTEHTETGDTPAEPPAEPSSSAASPEAILEAPPITFDQMGLLPEVLQALTDMGFVEPTEVQRVTYERVMAGRDLMVQSRTGSGKTAAFAIPMAEKLIDPAKPHVQALALCPTRELALQVAAECTRIGVHRGLKVAAIYGGAPMGKQIEQLKEGAQVVAGTPGRVLDHLRRGTLVLDRLKLLVLDECDEMLSMGFYEEISEILKRCPPPEARQTLLFSATIPEDIERIGARYMRDPEKVMLSTGYVGVQQITHAYYMVSGMGRSRDLVKVLKIEKPDSAIIFCNTREETSLVSEFLRREGMDAEAISSDLTQKDRERVMGRMRAGNLHYLVATDIAARGIDISDLSHVINYTFPESAEVYVHRTGRTGRAGKSGIAISLISPRELGNFYYLKLTYKIRPDERMIPSEEEEAAKRDTERVERLVKSLDKSSLAGEEWRRLARRVWTMEGGEGVIATLVKRFLSAPEVASAAPLPVEAEATPTVPTTTGPSGGEPGEGEAAPRERAGSRYGGDRERGGRRDRTSRERPAREGRGAAPGRADAPARSHSGRSSTSAPASSERAVPIAPPSTAATHTAEAPAVTRAPASTEAGERPAGAGPERTRRRRERDSDRRPAPKRKPSVGGVIDAPEGRDFWEVWAEDRPPGDATAPASKPAVEGAASDETEARPGTVRLFLSLGRRDEVGPAEMEALLAQHALKAERIHVRHSHSYIIVADEDADRFIAVLHGLRHGERDLVCERARRA